MLCPHNYGRYYGNVITDVSGFRTYWETIAAEFADNDLVMFDTNNECASPEICGWKVGVFEANYDPCLDNTMDQNLVVQLNQAAIDGIRAAGATTQYITPEGNAWSGAWSWTSWAQQGGLTNGQTMGSLTDPSNKLIYQMHQYLDSDSSGTSQNCVSSTIGAERLQDATAWLRQNGFTAIIGEYAAGNNAQCREAINGMLEYMAENNDVWLGALWWAAGPWWQGYMYSIEPPSDPAYTYYFDDLIAHA